MMAEHLERLTQQGMVRADGSVTPFNAGDAIAALSDWASERNIPLAPQVRARLGKGAKALLSADFPPQIVFMACVTALRTGWYGSTETIAQDLMTTEAGERIRRGQYSGELERLAHKMEIADSPVWQRLRGDDDGER